MVEAPWQELFNFRQRRANTVDDGECQHSARLSDRHQGTCSSVHRNRIALHLKSVMIMRDLTHENGLVVDHFNRKSFPGHFAADFLSNSDVSSSPRMMVNGVRSSCQASAVKWLTLWKDSSNRLNHLVKRL
jgi:hypothetical protein